MKKVVLLILACLIVFSVSAFAEEGTVDTSFRVIFDGEEISFPDEKPFTKETIDMPDGTVYKENDNRIKFVPIRAIGEALGYTVSWNGEKKTVTLIKGEREVKFVLGGQCYVNGSTKTCVVNFPMKGDRAFVSQFGVCHAFSCTMSWDEENRILHLYSKEKYPMEVDMTQERYLTEDVRSETIGEFYSMAEPDFVVPGMQQAFVPQGIAYRKDTNQFYVSEYVVFGSSRLPVVDAESGEMVAQYRMRYASGNPHTGHMSGVAVSEKNLYLVNGAKAVQIIPLSSVDAADPNGVLQVDREIKLSTGAECKNSYAEVSDGYLWLGNYYRAKNKNHSKKANENYNVLIRGYKLDAAEADGLDAQYKIDNPETNYLPAVLYSLENEEMIQGMTSAGRYIITANSYTETLSEINVYDTSKPAQLDGYITIGETQIPVYKLKLEKNVKTIEHVEELSVVDGYLYVIYESGSQNCGDANRGPLTDQVWKVDLEKLVAPVSE